MEENPSAAEPVNRRPLRVRNWRIMHALAARCAAKGIRPNQVSLSSIAGAVVAAIGIYASGYFAAPAAIIPSVLLALAGIFWRVMANLIDGMIAVEGGFRTRSGEVFNDAPDRIADSIIFIALGYAAGHAWLGWLAALLSVMTAYVRLLGGACGLKQSFAGPMAKPHRMAVTVAAVLMLLLEKLHGGTGRVSLSLGLVVIGGGSLLTAALRLRRIVEELECPRE
jgi:phosphatidylglycerophosphate synthase